MKSRVIGMTLFFIALMICVSLVFVYADSKSSASEKGKAFAVDANEVARLIEQGDTAEAAAKADELGDSLRSFTGGDGGDNSRVMIICLIASLFAVSVFAYVWFAILRPFEKMKAFAEKIAQGNFDVPLNYERSNYFGSFTWAFDSMRREITKARACEREAIDNNKTVIATLSHDIKTPVASIRAYAEGLDANLDTSPERRSRYLATIMRKCDEVSKLTNDLFLHSLSDLDKLRINPERFELTSMLETAVKEISAEHGDVTFLRPDFTAEVNADKNRVMQIAENLINNARKYAKTTITVTLDKQDDRVLVRFADKGRGIPDEDVPFIFEKFYRGKNCGDEQGSGLGLYIVRYLAEAQGGEVSLRNIPTGGLEVTVSLPTVRG